MFDKIVVINKNGAIVKINEGVSVKDLINLHVVFIDSDKKILGQIDSIDNDSVSVSFLGEIDNDDFIGGTLRKPSMDAVIRPINDDELRVITGDERASIILGVSPIYNAYPLRVRIDDLFSNHTAIFGNTGSGKTNGICRIIQNSFFKGDLIAYKANMFIFDSYGEYINAFSHLDSINPYYKFKVITTNPRNDYDVLNIPVCLLNYEDILNLLDCNDFSQVAIVETAITYAKMFARDDSEAHDYKNHILAKAISSIFYTNQTSSKIRDQIFEILNETSTNEINLSAEVKGIGFTRRFRDCFDIDMEGRFAERTIIIEYIKSFIKDDYKWDYNTSDVSYSLKDLEVALNFTLYSERYLLNEKMYDSAMSLKVKLHELVNRQKSKYFSNEYITLDNYIKKIQIKDNMKCQIVNFNLEDVDDRFARSVVKIFGRMFLRYTRSLDNRASFPIHMILEEAHRYVIDEDDKKLLGYNIFERIAKEGRKYGLIMDLITQRPTDLNGNVISQCANFIIFKINHPSDLEYISRCIPNMDNDIVEKQKTLQSGTCIAFGKLFKIPMIVKMQKADPEPSSSNCEIFNNWMVKIRKE